MNGLSATTMLEIGRRNSLFFPDDLIVVQPNGTPVSAGYNRMRILHMIFTGLRRSNFPLIDPNYNACRERVRISQPEHLRLSATAFLRSQIKYNKP